MRKKNRYIDMKLLKTKIKEYRKFKNADINNDIQNLKLKKVTRKNKLSNKIWRMSQVPQPRNFVTHMLFSDEEFSSELETNSLDMEVNEIARHSNQIKKLILN